MSQSQYFRAGAGSIIYNEAGEIVLFNRLDRPDVWQLQQGGMDFGETVEETLWRELLEETALTPENFTNVTAYPNWLHYEYPFGLRNHNWDPNCAGQIHCWFFLKINPQTKIDITNAVDKEFTNWKWSTFAQLLEESDSLKLAVYQELGAYFNENILARKN